MSKPVVEAGRGTSSHGKSIKAPRLYEKLRAKGYSKAKAARVSNAAANGTIDHHGGKGRFALATAGSTRMHGARGNVRGSGGRAKVTKAASVRGGSKRGTAHRSAKARRSR
jgi:hypothetical protein